MSTPRIRQRAAVTEAAVCLLLPLFLCLPLTCRAATLGAMHAIASMQSSAASSTCIFVAAMALAAALVGRLSQLRRLRLPPGNSGPHARRSETLSDGKRNEARGEEERWSQTRGGMARGMRGRRSGAAVDDAIATKKQTSGKRALNFAAIRNAVHADQRRWKSKTSKNVR